MLKKIGIGAVMAAALAAALFLLLRDKESTQDYRTETLTRGSIIASVASTGTVNAVTTVLVGTQVSGTIKSIYVDFNSPVRKGQLIAQIDPATFEAQAQQARANLLLAQANLEKANAAHVDTKRTLDRNKELFAKDLVARSDLDSAETNYETAKAQVGAARAQVEQAKAATEFAETNLRYTRIISPVAGIVVSRNVDVGQTVAASFQTPTLFTIAEDLTKMQIDTNVGEADIGRVKVGQEVEFTVDAFPDATFKGTVGQVRIAPIIVQNVVTYDVVVRVNNRDLLLKPGMTANVSIISDIREDVLRIPNAALRFRPSEKGTAPPERKGPAVWILENGKPKRVTVAVGISDGNYTELVSGGLKEGQALIVEALKRTKAQATSGPRMF